MLAALAIIIVQWWRSGGMADWMPVVVPFEAPDGEAAFRRWLDEDPDRPATFARFEQFLQDEGVSGIVPAWQLMRVDAFYARRCEEPPFAIPPEELWPNVVPALALVRDHVVETFGPVEVRSSWRSPQINVCARGASRSNHLDFAALDLGTADRRRGADLYRELCEMQQRAGPGSAMGLGAYFRPDEPESGGGRFHIDAQGFRTWGRDYTSRSSPCPALTAGRG